MNLSNLSRESQGYRGLVTDHKPSCECRTDNAPARDLLVHPQWVSYFRLYPHPSTIFPVSFVGPVLDPYTSRKVSTYIDFLSHFYPAPSFVPTFLVIMAEKRFDLLGDSRERQVHVTRLRYAGRTKEGARNKYEFEYRRRSLGWRS